MDDERKAELIAAYRILEQFEGDPHWMGVALEVADSVRPGPSAVRMLEDLAETRRELASARAVDRATTVYVSTPDHCMWAYSPLGGWERVFFSDVDILMVEVPWRRNEDGTVAHPASVPELPHPRDIAWETRRPNMYDPNREVVRTWTPATLAREAYQWGKSDAQTKATSKRLPFQGDSLHLGGVLLEALRDDTAGKTKLVDEVERGMLS